MRAYEFMTDLFEADVDRMNQAWKLYHDDNLPLQDVAAKLGLSPASVYNALVQHPQYKEFSAARAKENRKKLMKALVNNDRNHVYKAGDIRSPESKTKSNTARANSQGWEFSMLRSKEEQEQMRKSFVDDMKTLTAIGREHNLSRESVGNLMKMFMSPEEYSAYSKRNMIYSKTLRKGSVATAKIYKAGTIDNDKTKGPNSKHSAGQSRPSLNRGSRFPKPY